MADPATDYFYQTVGFHFKVTFEGLKEGKDADIRFQAVSGLDVQLDTETIKEGGENRFTHTIPGRTNFPSGLTLKRGLLLPVIRALRNGFTMPFSGRSLSLCRRSKSHCSTKITRCLSSGTCHGFGPRAGKSQSSTRNEVKY